MPKPQINFKGLRDYLESKSWEDFKNGNVVNGISRLDIDRFSMDESKIMLNQVIEYGTPFLVDSIGNDLSVVWLMRRKYKLPNGRAIHAKFDRTVITDCRKQYGDCLNGYWKIPKQFILF